MFLTIAYFQGDLYLPNQIKSESVGHSSTSRQTIGENNLNWFIEKYETEFLIELLGYTLFQNFKTGIHAESPLKIWTDLRDYLYRESNGFYFSPAANYVFFFVSRRGRTQTAVQGEIKGTMSYAEIAEDSDKLVKVWNDMCDMVSCFNCDFLSKRWDDYKGYSDGKHCKGKFIKINKFGI